MALILGCQEEAKSCLLFFVSKLVDIVPKARLVAQPGMKCRDQWRPLTTKCQRHGTFSPSHGSVREQFAVPLALLSPVETATRHFMPGWAINVPLGQQRIATDTPQPTNSLITAARPMSLWDNNALQRPRRSQRTVLSTAARRRSHGLFQKDQRLIDADRQWRRRVHLFGVSRIERQAVHRFELACRFLSR